MRICYMPMSARHIDEMSPEDFVQEYKLELVGFRVIRPGDAIKKDEALFKMPFGLVALRIVCS